jgi:hypothetical protein
MKVIYPGPAVPVGLGPTFHPKAGRLVVGVNELEDCLAEELVACGLVKLPESPKKDVPSKVENAAVESKYSPRLKKE